MAEDKIDRKLLIEQLEVKLMILRYFGAQPQYVTAGHAREWWTGRIRELEHIIEELKIGGLG